ncbi:MAG TPA: glycine--tRNA ligase subunit beta [Synergistales bacterium]|mgnify:CR=1 FL=1|nr:glycine--tRNA ligase subunit beta [Synergistales bacterium]HRV70688.1 glycine--tRNA ligase subunit beta [Thermovirgaceae bacterium]
MGKRDLLLEIGTEEIPSRFIPPSLSELSRIAGSEMKTERLSFDNIQTFGTPRRMAFIVRDLAERQEDLIEEFKGPAWSSAFDGSGNPTKAARGFAKSRGVEVDSLEKRTFGENDFAVAVIRQEGRPVIEILPGLLERITGGISFPKSMYWDRTFTRFARPVRWLLALYGDTPINFGFGSVKSGKTTRGHRFMGKKIIEIENTAEYLEKLHDNFVIADPEKRKEKMVSGIAGLEKEIGGKAVLDEDLMEENLFLVEYPVPFFGSFDQSFLDIPAEVLITSMKNHQRYFPVRDTSGALKPFFVGVSNNRATNMSVVREGNERVLRARLSDAAFFWKEDQKVALSARVESLKKIIHHEKLGTVYEKVSLVRELCSFVSETLSLSREETELVDRAAMLSRADTATEMVYEFPELRGVMGREYALKGGEDPRVALALYEQYLPAFSGDDVPKDKIGGILGICDRIDTITGGFKAGLQPTGSQDPYGIRRASRTLNEILWGSRIDVDILQILAESARQRGLSEAETLTAREFILQRLHNQLREKGFSHELTTLAVSVAGSRPMQAMRMLDVFSGIQDSEWFSGLVVSAVRVKNILQKAQERNMNLDSGLLVEKEEKELFEIVETLSPDVASAVAGSDWDGLARLLARLEPFITSFFDHVLVMDKDEKIRSNRIALLEKCNDLFRTAGDLGVLKS